MDDREAGMLIGKGLYRYEWTWFFAPVRQYDVRHRITIEVRDGRYRYTVEDLKVQEYMTVYKQDIPIREWRVGQTRIDEQQARIAADIEMLLASLKGAMAAQPKARSDW